MSDAVPTQMTGSSSSINPRILENKYVALKQCRHGFMIYNLNDLFVGKAMDLYGEWCETELFTLGQLIREGDIVIDVGANIGTHTVFFAQKVADSGSVLAIEPQRIIYEFLCANIALNALVNVIPLQIALGDRAGDAIIPLYNPANVQNFAATRAEGHTNGDIVKIVPLDDLNLERCKLIKIDVEGMELKVLRGAKNTIQRCRPFLFVENNEREGSPETVQELFDLGYNCWWHIGSYYSPNNFFENPENVFVGYHPEANMIGIPKERNFNVTGYIPVTDPSDNWVRAMERMGIPRE